MYKRQLILKYTVMLLLFCLCLQLFSITQTSAYLTFSENQSVRTVTLYQTRGVIYDRNLSPLTESAEVKEVTIGEKSASYLAPVRDHSIAPHIIGYLSDGVGVTGIEAAFEDYLSAAAETATASAVTFGSGEVAPNAEISFQFPPAPTQGVVLTLDAKLQKTVNKTESLIEKGAVVCMDADTGEILALASFPSFDDPAKALNSTDSPLYNRALAAYPIGSVMKPVIAAAALESGYSVNMGFDCTGSITVGNVTFRCHKRDGHGTVNLYDAIMQSCNPYFVDLTSDIASEVLLETAYRFGLSQSIPLADGINCDFGSLPESMTAGEKANFSFGQGKLTAAPLQICAIYAAIANGGTYHTPVLIKGTTGDGENLSPLPETVAQEIIDPNTTSILQEALYKTVNETENSLARSELTDVYGKTGTAQTGRYENGEEILIGWFAGWFEAEGKTVAIAVMAEDAESGNADAAPAMKMIAERMKNEENPI